MYKRNTVTEMAQAWRTRVARLTGALCRKVWPVFPRTDWVPAHQLQCVSGQPHVFNSTGNDPQFRLKHPAPAGWYMLEVQMRLTGALGEVRLYCDLGQGASEETSLPLRIRSEQLAKRLVYLPSRAKLRFDPTSKNGQFEVQRLQLVRVSARFAAKRMREKLLARHPGYKNGSVADLKTVADQWKDYCNLFVSGSELLAYSDWIKHVEASRVPDRAEQAAVAATWAKPPTFSVITPTFNTDPSMLSACLDSVLAQGYPHWELCIADDASTAPHVREILERYAAQDPRIRVTFRQQNGHIVEASNTALSMATGEFVVLLDHDDTLAPHALFAVAQAIIARPTAQLIYSDEDKLNAAGERCDPYFKPDYSPDLLYSQNYFSHLGVYRRELVETAGGFRKGFEGSQDYDLVLRCVSHVLDVTDIVHISQVLYHWRMAEGSTAAGHDQKSYASEAGRAALQDHFNREGKQVEVTVTAPGIYRHRWPLVSRPQVSLVIPTRDAYSVLKTCIDSILERTVYENYEILVVDNQSTCAQTLAYLEQIATGPKVRVLRYDAAFNYSAINNFAAKHARGSILGLINNDVEVINGDWLTEMVSHAIRPDIGCVGAKLYYPDDTIQHGGVICGLGGVANHSHRHFPKGAPGYFGRLWLIHNLSAVTAAVLLLRREIFDEVGGLDDAGLPVAFNDVDLCLKVMMAGYRNLWTPFAELYHHESISRGADETPEKRARFVGECQVMYARWSHLLASDPYYNRNLTRQRADFSLACDAEA